MPWPRYFTVSFAKPGKLSANVAGENVPMNRAGLEAKIPVHPVTDDRDPED